MRLLGLKQYSASGMGCSFNLVKYHSVVHLKFVYLKKICILMYV